MSLNNLAYFDKRPAGWRRNEIYQFRGTRYLALEEDSPHTPDKTRYCLFPLTLQIHFQGQPRVLNYYGSGSFNVAFKFSTSKGEYIYRVLRRPEQLNTYPDRADLPERTARLLNLINHFESDACAVVHREAGWEGVIVPFFYGRAARAEEAYAFVFELYQRTGRILVDIITKGNLLVNDETGRFFCPDVAFAVLLKQNGEDGFNESVDSQRFWRKMHKAYLNYFNETPVRCIQRFMIQALLFIEHVGLKDYPANLAAHENQPLVALFAQAYEALHVNPYVCPSALDKLPGHLKAQVDIYFAIAAKKHEALTLLPLSKEQKEALETNFLLTRIHWELMLTLQREGHPSKEIIHIQSLTQNEVLFFKKHRTDGLQLAHMRLLSTSGFILTPMHEQAFTIALNEGYGLNEALTMMQDENLCRRLLNLPYRKWLGFFQLNEEEPGEVAGMGLRESSKIYEALS